MAVVFAVVCCSVGAFAATASAAGVTTVYKNGFKSAGSVKVLKKVGGNRCQRGYDGKNNQLLLTVKAGKAMCPWKLPVVGDSALPSHQIRYKGKIMKTTEGANVRKRATLVSSLRVGDNVRYELRIYPRTQRYQLVRFPDSNQFPIAGRSGKVKKIGKTNTVAFRTFGARVMVTINGTTFISILDNNPGQVEGAKIWLGAGNGTDTSKPVRAAFKEVSISVPSPY